MLFTPRFYHAPLADLGKREGMMTFEEMEDQIRMGGATGQNILFEKFLMIARQDGEDAVRFFFDWYKMLPSADKPEVGGQMRQIKIALDKIFERKP